MTEIGRVPSTTLFDAAPPDWNTRGLRMPPSGPLFTAALLAVLLVWSCISAMLLTELGFNYEQPGGLPFSKIHPGTLLAAGVLILAMAATGRPILWLERVIAERPGVAVFLLATIGMMAHCIILVGAPFTTFIDTFVGPVIAFWLFKDIGDARARMLARIIHVVLAVNALVGIAEFASGNRLIPLWIAGELTTSDWRSSALFGHPLSNASITGCYCIIVMLGGGRDIGSIARTFCLAINTAAMVTFGGRAATVMLVAVILLMAAHRFAGYVAGRPFSRAGLVTALLTLPVAIGIVLVLAEAGYFARFVERFIDDQGSAATRIGMFDLLFSFQWQDLLIAPDLKHVETMQRHYGLDYGIESVWIAFIIFYGIIPSIVFFAAMFWFLKDVVRSARRASFWVVLFFLAVASTSVSLYGKGPQFAILVMHILILLRRDSVPEPYLAERIGLAMSGGTIAGRRRLGAY
ncbi:MAG TPA: VpsF family polysaccharide biosynthesis protein [Hyphomicrobiaceae bacterium]|nr:VpsF family polysaccharide biosynthesis protein [Hyphomicrobiaceae bacterium]